MKKLRILSVILLMLGAGAAAMGTVYFQKLPKCSGQLCREIGCPADVLCAKGTKVVTCADYCNSN